MVTMQFHFWKVLVFTILFLLVLAGISFFLEIKNIGFEKSEQVVLETVLILET